MAVELHVAALRALLSCDVDEHLRLVGEIDREGSVDAYGVFYEATFAEAVHRRFGAEATRGDVIRFVAQIRANRSRHDDFDILAAERLLLAVLGDQRAMQRLTEEDTALIAPLLLELAKTLPADELLANAQELADQVEAALAESGRKGEE